MANCKSSSGPTLIQTTRLSLFARRSAKPNVEGSWIFRTTLRPGYSSLSRERESSRVPSSHTATVDSVCIGQQTGRLLALSIGHNRACATPTAQTWLAKHKDINKLVLQSGHDSVDVMWRHYHRGTTEKHAKKFWTIRPKGLKPGNIIEFKRQSGSNGFRNT
jgi:hypothetical protein